MSQLTKSQFDSTYNQASSGSFKNNTSQLITAGIIRQFAKDIEDSIPFLYSSNTFTNGQLISAFDTSVSAADLDIVRTGSLNLNIGHGSFFRLRNSTSSKSCVIQGAEDNLQFFTYNGSSYTERIRLDSSGLLRLGDITSSVVPADSNIGLIRGYYLTSDTSDFHIAAYFQSQQTVATTHSIQGIEGYTAVSHPSGAVTLAIGTIGNIEMASTATLSTARSLQAGGNTSVAGTITEWDGVYVGFANSGGASFGSLIGVYIDTFPSGATNKYGIINAETTAKSGFGVTAPTAMVDLLASTTSIASLRIRHGAAPSSPNDGDMWTTTSGAFIRINGVTKTFTLT